MDQEMDSPASWSIPAIILSEYSTFHIVGRTGAPHDPGPEPSALWAASAGPHGPFPAGQPHLLWRGVSARGYSFSDLSYAPLSLEAGNGRSFFLVPVGLSPLLWSLILTCPSRCLHPNTFLESRLSGQVLVLLFFLHSCLLVCRVSGENLLRLFFFLSFFPLL